MHIGRLLNKVHQFLESYCCELQDWHKIIRNIENHEVDTKNVTNGHFTEMNGQYTIFSHLILDES